MIHDVCQMELKIQTDGNLISMREFSYFHYHFVAAYSLAHEIVTKNEIRTVDELMKVSIEKLRSAISQKNNVSYYARQYTIPKEFDIYLIDINRQNPIIEILAGSIVILVLAVVFSGGKIEITKDSFKAELPPIGIGIKSIKDAFKSDLSTIDFDKK